MAKQTVAEMPGIRQELKYKAGEETCCDCVIASIACLMGGGLQRARNLDSYAMLGKLRDCCCVLLTP